MLILGSSSPARQKALREAGYQFTVLSADIDEKAIRHEHPENLTHLLANAKLDALIERVTEPATLVCADTVVFFNGEIWEKPADEKEHREMLQTVHSVPFTITTSVAVINLNSQRRASGTDTVSFRLDPLPSDLVETLITEPKNQIRAGGFGVQDIRLAPYLHPLEGNVEAAVGIPISVLRNLLEEVAYSA
ncbi:MAG: Maf family protein [bacterium]